jgi:hypothetical protein
MSISRFVLGAAVLTGLVLPARSAAQVGTLGAGALVTESNTDGVAEVYLGAPPIRGFRPYGIASFTKGSWSPTFITAVEHEIVTTSFSFTTLGAGLVWPEFKDYRGYPILTSTTVFPLPFSEKLSFVVVGSTQPFQDYEWTLVAKVAITLFFSK